MKKYILLLTLFCPLLVWAQTENPKSLPSDSLSTTLHAEQLMAKDTLSVPLPAPVLQHYLYSPFDIMALLRSITAMRPGSCIKDSMRPSA